MKPFPTDPMRQNDRLIMAVCDDLWGQCFKGETGHAIRVAEIIRQTNQSPTERDGGRANNAPPTNDE